MPEQRDGFIEYPKVIYPSNFVEKPVVVHTEAGWLEYKAKGWSEKPFEMTALGQLKANIAFHENEYIRLRQELAELEGVPEVVEEVKEPFVEVPFGGAVPVDIPEVKGVITEPKVETLEVTTAPIVETVPVEVKVVAAPPADVPIEEKPKPFTPRRVRRG